MISEIAWYLRPWPRAMRKTQSARWNLRRDFDAAPDTRRIRRGHGRGPFLAGRRPRSVVRQGPGIRPPLSRAVSWLCMKPPREASWTRWLGVAIWRARHCCCCSTSIRATPFAARRACTTPTPLARRIATRRARRRPRPGGAGGPQAFHVPAVRPFRRPGRPGARGCALPAPGQPHLAHAEGTATSSGASGGSRIETPILGRTTTPEEQRFLDEGGFAGAEASMTWTKQPRGR